MDKIIKHAQEILYSWCEGRKCSQACLAMVSGLPEKQIHSMFWNNRGMTGFEFLIALYQLKINIKLPRRYVESIKYCLIVVRTEDGDAHCLMKHKNRFYDPMYSPVSSPTIDPTYKILCAIPIETQT